MDRNNHKKIIQAAAEKKRTAFESKCYTSLKDLINDESMQIPPSYTKEDLMLQLKNPLLQTAAWAYLQPMKLEPERGNKWFKWARGIKIKNLFSCVKEALEAIFKAAS